MSKKVLVFGGCGFLGSYLVERLCMKKYEVTVADLNLSKYINKDIFVECNILDKIKVAELVKNADIVYNFAGMANLDKAVEDPCGTIELNVIGNLNILDACMQSGVERFVYASSAYSMSDKGSFYGISKLTSEKLIEEYNAKYDLKYTIIRYGSVYSERISENNYIYNLLKNAIISGKIKHFGDGEEIREYIHASDVAQLSVEIIESNQFENEHIILTGMERMKRKELFEMINDILGNKLEIELNDNGYEHHYKTTPYSFTPRISKKLIPNPYIDIGQGILETIKSIYEREVGDK
ncbi:NAD-dependent epimerase/dehydratase family protein [Methanococcoides burtonii]|uniref:NAD-dependent sugar epimerase/dehydratase n=1 Tax=Methanococcoides burtonii (strain DSM 6242 / NBRC 107633 / OCM 468 / ACE-M) TaxID=259564 RepID=Q12VM5_METBU|nr:NAD(P)-dependent oxidoreductase [Methanococcoides burtonii]ABE52501.1 NAD-dependent sugar epimerase/dehydratase [Methanococcoides burtonii DSM 6242]